MDEEKRHFASEKMTFLYQSISDLQGTIRAIDTKLGIVFVILSLPFSTIGSIYGRFRSISEICTGLRMYFAYATFVAFAVLWFMAFVIALRGLIGIDNPTCHIYGSDATGVFYSAGLFSHRFSDAFFNRASLRSTRCVEAHLSLIPTSEEALLGELAFEQMKLAYIRDIKQLRHRWSFRLTFFWLLLGLGVYLFIRSA